MRESKLRQIGFWAMLGLLLSLASVAGAQTDPPYDLRINFSEANLNTVIDCAVAARAINYGDWDGDTGWLQIQHWFVNLNDANIDLKANNQIELEVPDLEIQANINLGVLDFLVNDPDEHVDCTIYGEVLSTGDETEGLVLVIRVDDIDIHDVWGNNPDWLEALMQMVGNIVILVSDMPSTSINMGTRFLPDFLDGLFTSSIPGITTTETALYAGFDVQTQYLPFLADPDIASGSYQAIQMIEAGLVATVNSSSTVEFACSDSVRSGCFRASRPRAVASSRRVSIPPRRRKARLRRSRRIRAGPLRSRTRSRHRSCSRPAPCSNTPESTGRAKPCSRFAAPGTRCWKPSRRRAPGSTGWAKPRAGTTR